MDYWVALILGAAGGLITASIGGLIAWRKLRPDIRKTDAETAGLVGQAWLDLLTPMREEIANLRVSVSELKKEIEARDEQRTADQKRIEELEAEVAELRKQIEDLGHEPRTNQRRDG